MDKMTVYGTEHFRLVPDQNEIFRWLQCTPDLPCRAAYEGAWIQTEKLLNEKVCPSVIFLRKTDTQLDILLTLGPDAEEAASQLFRRGEYIQGSLLNVMCDEMLFQLDNQAAALLQQEIAKEELYMASRLEPGAGLEQEEQSASLQHMREALPFLSLSCHGVLSPSKSMMYRVMLSEAHCAHAALHDCSQCSQKDCLYRTPGT